MLRFDEAQTCGKKGRAATTREAAADRQGQQALVGGMAARLAAGGGLG
jgi:hypothetical protein